jgi:predicted phosphodiesterase
MVIARVVTTGECPSLEVDSRFVPMLTRSKPQEKFPVTSCEAVVPEGVRSIQVKDQNNREAEYVALPVPTHHPKKIVVVGDTGCRIKFANGKGLVQDCNNAADWPFPKIMEVAAKYKPDLVIHVGDYLYRETPCPRDPKTGQELAKCAGSPWGYGWDAWKADLFKPAEKLLAVAPWIFIRGNHELCSRAGEGWFRYLDPRVYSAVCTDRTESYRVVLGNLNMAIMDSSAADDNKAEPQAVDYYSNQIARVEAGQKSDWILTHRPFWGLVSYKDSVTSVNATLQESARKMGLMVTGGPVDLVLAGHIHLYEAFTFEDAGPSQVIVGNGGTELDYPVLSKGPKGFKGTQMDSRKVKTASIYRDFGFLTLESGKNGDWIASARKETGAVITKFLIHGNQLKDLKP